MKSPLISLVRQPKIASAQPPLLVLLHGVGSNEEDLFGLEDAFAPEFVVVSVRAPLEMRPGSYAWFPVQFTPEGPVADPIQAEASRQLLVDFLGVVGKEYSTDPNRVVVAGFSQGAIMAASLMITRPELLAGAVLMSGRVLPEVLPLAATDRLAGVRVLIVHGTGDHVLPVFHGRASRQTLEGLGIHPDYREFAMGHTVSDESLAAVAGWVNGLVSRPQ